MKIGATQSFARFAVNLSHRQILPEVIDRAKVCILDTLAVALYGSTKPWSQSVIEFIRSSGAKGRSTVLGEGWKAQAPQATLANGVMDDVCRFCSVTTSSEPASIRGRSLSCSLSRWRRRKRSTARRCLQLLWRHPRSCLASASPQATLLRREAFMLLH